MPAGAWRPGMPTRCKTCGGTDLRYLDDGSAVCNTCGTTTRPISISRPNPESFPSSASLLTVGQAADVPEKQQPQKPRPSGDQSKVEILGAEPKWKETARRAAVAVGVVIVIVFGYVIVNWAWDHENVFVDPATQSTSGCLFTFNLVNKLGSAVQAEVGIYQHRGTATGTGPDFGTLWSTRTYDVPAHTVIAPSVAADCGPWYTASVLSVIVL